MKTAEHLEQSVYVVDDDEPLRTAVTRMLKSAGHRVKSFGSAAEFLLAREGPLRGCIVLDVRMPGPSGFELQAGLNRQAESVPVIFLTGHGDIPMSVRAIKAGAVDFLTKPVLRDTLLSAVDSALALDQERWSRDENRRAMADRLASLTPCELEVYRRVVEGQPNKQIAAEVGSAERTVKAHRARVMEKMGARSIAELVHIADSLASVAEETV
ncbi:response regulator transcription factor [Luteolibacter luteus]|uniref:Response regulator transcription factor n=1 Tax=Luteolibacter luteus TaxID=2728835 RepID=A0A858RS13_9BACT|nr:response regulator [Luteolibacter luteus]QJE98930.1 response regulator transcription factor [Luteolibacter luteus]